MLREKLLSHLEQYGKGPYLLALSGGPDSTALFYHLFKLQVPFEVAHFDHGWRQESKEESIQLEQLCKQHSIIFHLGKSNQRYEKNKEEKAREERLAFFHSLLLAHSHLKGVLLGHHRGDCAETILKRLFEGARLTKLYGLLPVSTLENISLHRPWIEVPKEEILKWLNTNKIQFFIDPTNLDGSNLRSRMREKILPDLSEQFGKNIENNLLKLGKEVSELHAFVNHFVDKERLKFRKESHVFEWNVESLLTYHPFLTSYLLRAFFDFCGTSVSQATLQQVLKHVQRKTKRKQIVIGKGMLFFDYPVLTFANKRIDEQ